MSNSSNTSSDSPSIPAGGSPQSPVGGAYKAVGSTLTVVVVGGLLWGLALTVVKAIAIFTG